MVVVGSCAVVSMGSCGVVELLPHQFVIIADAVLTFAPATLVLRFNKSTGVSIKRDLHVRSQNTYSRYGLEEFGSALVHTPI